MLHKLIAILLISVGGIGDIQGQSMFLNFDQDVLFMDSIYQFRFPDGIKNYPDEDHPAVIIRQISWLWWMFITTNDEEYGIEILNCYNSIVEEEKPSVLEEMPLWHFKHLVVGLYSVRTLNVLGKKMQCVHHGFNLLPHLKYILKNKAYSLEFTLISGMYHMGVGWYKKRNLALKPLIICLPEANYQQGCQFVDFVLRAGDKILQTEANYFLFKFHSDGGHSHQMRKSIDWLCDNYPDNLVYLIDRNRSIGKKIDYVEIRKKLVENVRLTKAQKGHLLSVISFEEGHIASSR